MEPDSASASSQTRPYRWGKFQGWLCVVAGLLWASVATCAFVASESAIGRAIVDGALSGSGSTDVLSRWQAWQVGRETGDFAYVGGFFVSQLLLTLGTGVGILKKRTFGIVLILLLILRAATWASLLALAFWAGSLPYYNKRRKEFRSL